MRRGLFLRAVAALAALPLLVAACVAAGALLWAVQLAGRGPAPPAAADGIVVLTGGAERIATALRLLADGRGPVLLVSGVGGSAGYADLVRRAGDDPALHDPELARRVTLGRAAASTYGNARETADWARGRGVRSLIVVTAWYHMPRALTELSRALPGVRLYPVAVQPPPLHGLAQWRLLADEYAKWVVAVAGLSRYAEPPTAAAPGAGGSLG